MKAAYRKKKGLRYGYGAMNGKQTAQAVTNDNSPEWMELALLFGHRDSVAARKVTEHSRRAAAKQRKAQQTKKQARRETAKRHVFLTLFFLLAAELALLFALFVENNAPWYRCAAPFASFLLLAFAVFSPAEKKPQRDGDCHGQV